MFYTNVYRFGDNIYYTFKTKNGKKKKGSIQYKPSFFVPSKKKAKYTDIYGNFYDRIEFNSIREAEGFRQKYKDVTNFRIHGFERYEYCFLSDIFSNEIKYNFDLLNIFNFDIETDSKNGFPEPTLANSEILVIGITTDNGKSYDIFGRKDDYREDKNTTLISKNSKIHYILCSSEKDLLREFVNYWSKNEPDILTGYNIVKFDIPYIINRIKKIFDEKESKKLLKKLSPYNLLPKEETFHFYNQEIFTYRIPGIGTYDYYEAYKKFGGKNLENNSLNQVAFEELGERKLDYSEYSNLDELYENDFQKYVDYNIRDVELIQRLEDKLNIIRMLVDLTYDIKSNFGDVFYQVRMWDILTFNYCRNRNIVVPPKKENIKKEKYPGGYVKSPKLGFSNWVVSFDVNSEYPNIMISWNMSNETLVSNDKKDYDDNVNELLNEKPLSFENECANGHAFRKDKQGMFAYLMEFYYDKRQEFKSKKIKHKIQYNQTKDDYDKLMTSIYGVVEKSRKTNLNSGYGAIGNEYFRFYDLRIASAVTLTGQYCIRWIEKQLNKFMNEECETKNIDYCVAIDTDSCGGNTEIYVNNKKMKIEDFYDLQEENYIKYDDFNCDYIKEVNNHETISVNNKGEIEKKKINYVMKHKVKKEMFKIKTKDKEVIITEDHSIMVNRNNKIISCKPKEIKKDDKIILLKY